MNTFLWVWLEDWFSSQTQLEGIMTKYYGSVLFLLVTEAVRKELGIGYFAEFLANQGVRLPIATWREIFKQFQIYVENRKGFSLVPSYCKISDGFDAARKSDLQWEELETAAPDCRAAKLELTRLLAELGQGAKAFRNKLTLREDQFHTISIQPELGSFPPSYYTLEIRFSGNSGQPDEERSREVCDCLLSASNALETLYPQARGYCGLNGTPQNYSTTMPASALRNWVASNAVT